MSAAYALIAERGFEGLRTREVAARAGVNIATLHYYFATKEDLIRGVVDYIEQQFAEQNAYVRAQGATAREQLHAELWHALEIKRDRPELQIVLHELFLRSLRDAAIHDIYRGMDTGWHTSLIEMVHAGIAEGSFRADLDVDAAASTIMVFHQGRVHSVGTGAGDLRVRARHRGVRTLALDGYRTERIEPHGRSIGAARLGRRTGPTERPAPLAHAGRRERSPSSWRSSI